MTDLMILEGLEVTLDAEEASVADEAPIVIDQTDDPDLAPDVVPASAIPAVAATLEAEAGKADRSAVELERSARDAAKELEAQRKAEEEARKARETAREEAARAARLEAARRVIWDAAKQAATRKLADILRAQAALLRLYEGARRYGDAQVMREASAAYDALQREAKLLRLEAQLAEIESLIARRKRMREEAISLMRQPIGKTTPEGRQRALAYREQLRQRAQQLQQEIFDLGAKRAALLKDIETLKGGATPEQLPERLEGFWSRVGAWFSGEAKQMHGGACDVAQSVNSGAVGAAAVASPYAALATAALAAVRKTCPKPQAPTAPPAGIIVHSDGPSIWPWVLGIGGGGLALYLILRRR